MTRIAPLLAALLLATPARAEEPDAKLLLGDGAIAEPKLGEGPIADACAMEFPADTQAAKACEVAFRLIYHFKFEYRILNLEYVSDAFNKVLVEQDARIVALEARITALEEHIAAAALEKK